MTRRPLLFLLLLLAGLGPACGGGDGGTGPPPAGPVRVRIVRAPSSPARNRLPFTQQPAVRLEANGGSLFAREGVSISVVLRQAGGTLQGTTTILTNPQGTAEFTDLALQGSAGPRRLVFSAPNLLPDTSLDVVIIGGDPTAIIAVSGNGQIGSVQERLAGVPIVLVSDVDNNPVPGAEVHCEVSLAEAPSPPPRQRPVPMDVPGAVFGPWALFSAFNN